jgi:hypothetical protein
LYAKCELPESITVPCLSIIVPHLNDDSGLEVTLLSILENRESDFEVLIAHDGGFTDPYGLGQDEAVLIESSRGASLSSQINLAVASACSPYIQVLMPGSTVDEHWFDEAIDILDSSHVSAVCLPIADAQSEKVFVGLASESLPHRRVSTDVNAATVPLMCGGVFRKKTFRAIGGWFEHSSTEVAEVELGLLIMALRLEIATVSSVGVHAPKRVAVGHEPGFEIGRACGQLACAFASIEDSGIAIDSLARRLGHLASGLMSPKTVAERLGWVMGIRERAFVRTVQSRVESACEAMAEKRPTIALPNATRAQEQRRAA